MVLFDVVSSYWAIIIVILGVFPVRVSPNAEAVGYNDLVVEALQIEFFEVERRVVGTSDVLKRLQYQPDDDLMMV